MSYESSPNLGLTVSGRSYSKNPPGVNLQPNPVTENAFNLQLEKLKGQERSLKLTLQEEKNKATGWDIATQRESNQTKSVKLERSIETTKQERHRLAADKVDTDTARREIEQARLRGKLSDTEKAILEVELGTKKDSLKTRQDFRKIQQKRDQFALKTANLDVKILEAQFNEKRALLRSQGFKIEGV